MVRTNRELKPPSSQFSVKFGIVLVKIQFFVLPSVSIFSFNFRFIVLSLYLCSPAFT